MHTIDTIMPSLANLRVHIAPVGFEVDRIVIPVKQTRADKIWLLVHNNSSEDKSLPYQKKLEQQFKKQKNPSRDWKNQYSNSISYGICTK